MPPRYAYWTILVDNQPTAFRAASQEDLMPTFNRLKEKHPTAEMKWFQNGKLWSSRLEAQDWLRMRGERGGKALSERSESKGRMGDKRQGGGFRDRKKFAAKGGESRRSSRPASGDELEWKPKGQFTPAPKRSDRPEWKPKGFAAKGGESRRSSRPASGDELEWKPKGQFTPAPKRSDRPEWKPRRSATRPAELTERRGQREGGPRSGDKLDWTPRSGHTGAKPAGEKRRWIPKEEYKKSQGIEARRDKNWRPGGEHKDPRQKYKDAKKAKWQRFKKTIRTKWESKKKKGDE